MAAVQETVDLVRSIDVEAYKYGFISPIESDLAPKGLSEDTVRFISEKKGEPEWLLEWRLEALRRWRTMDAPIGPSPIDQGAISANGQVTAIAINQNRSYSVHCCLVR